MTINQQMIFLTKELHTEFIIRTICFIDHLVLIIYLSNFVPQRVIIEQKVQIVFWILCSGCARLSQLLLFDSVEQWQCIVDL